MASELPAAPLGMKSDKGAHKMNDLFLEIPWVETSEAEFTYKRTGPVVDIGKELAWRAGLFDEAFREIQWIENADGE